MRVLPRSLAALAAALLLTTGLWSLPAARAQSTCAVSAAETALDAEEQAAVDQINVLRAQAGLAPLSVSPVLTRAARWKSLSMASGAPFAHDDSFRSWFQRVADCGYDTHFYVSENLAAGTSDSAETVNMWFDSPMHRANMLYPGVQTVGIARARGGEWGWYWTADFGMPAGDGVAADQPSGE